MDDKREKATKAVKQLQGELADTESMIKSLEGARMQLSSTADELLSLVEPIIQRVHAHGVALDKIILLLKPP